jgi:hypothetical protein
VRARATPTARAAPQRVDGGPAPPAAGLSGIRGFKTTSPLMGETAYELRSYQLRLGYSTVPSFLEYYGSGLPDKLAADGSASPRPAPPHVSGGAEGSAEPEQWEGNSHCFPPAGRSGVSELVALLAGRSGASELVTLLYSDCGPLNMVRARAPRRRAGRVQPRRCALTPGLGQVLELWRHESIERSQDSRRASRAAHKWKEAVKPQPALGGVGVG